MNIIHNFFHIITQFIYSDHKAEVIVGTSAAAATGFISSNNERFVQELMYRDINTIVISIVAAVAGFFVTMLLKSKFDNKDKK